MNDVSIGMFWEVEKDKLGTLKLMLLKIAGFLKNLQVFQSLIDCLQFQEMDLSRVKNLP